MLHAVFKLVVSLDNDPQHILEEGKIIVPVFVPVLGAGLKSLVVGVFALLNEHLNTDVLAHDESGAVQKQERQKSAHTAVPVIEGVDAEEIQDEYRHQEKRIIGAGLDGFVVFGAEVQHGICRLKSRDRTEADCFSTVCVFFCIKNEFSASN